MVTRLSVVAVGVVGLLVLATVPVAAHHAFSSEFDANRPVQLTGVVTKMEWVNPHSWIHIDVKKPDGTVEKWMIEGGTPNTLLRRGLSGQGRRTPGKRPEFDAPQRARPVPRVVGHRRSAGRSRFDGTWRSSQVRAFAHDQHGNLNSICAEVLEIFSVSGCPDLGENDGGNRRLRAPDLDGARKTSALVVPR